MLAQQRGERRVIEQRHRLIAAAGLAQPPARAPLLEQVQAKAPATERQKQHQTQGMRTEVSFFELSKLTARRLK